MPQGERSKPITPAEVRQAARWGRALITMAEKRPDVAEQLGITDDDIDEMRLAVDQTEKMVAKIPTAKAMFLSALSGRVTREEVLTRHHDTILAVHNLAAMAAYVAASKLDDHQAPGSTKVALEILKGTGVLVPAEPMASRKRSELLSQEVLSKKDAEELKAEVLKFS